ncbi:MAG: N-succinylarginine dihydrolase [Planctomycetota bacterium]
MSDFFEVNFDGIVGPTHNYAGLSPGNVASMKHANTPAHPRSAALQGLAKVKTLHELGVKQCVLPPHSRPELRVLKRAGLSGSEQDMIYEAGLNHPELLAQAYSASAMWTANAATITASPDANDGKLHLTPANLVSTPHRALESEQTEAILQQVFADAEQFAIHEPLDPAMPDEGAANHTRLCVDHGGPGLNVFTFGFDDTDVSAPTPDRFPARQYRTASEAVADAHGISYAASAFVQQNPHAIDAGVFHNDVICVGHRNALLVHQDALLHERGVMEKLIEKFEKRCGGPLRIVMIGRTMLPIEHAVSSYLFNSQIVDLPDGSMALVHPTDVLDDVHASKVVKMVLTDKTNPITRAVAVDVRQSMRNGGGPACLRLRVPMSEGQFAAVHRGVKYTPALHAKLAEVIESRYPKTVVPMDLQDPGFAGTVRAATEAVYRVLNLEM